MKAGEYLEKNNKGAMEKSRQPIIRYENNESKETNENIAETQKN